MKPNSAQIRAVWCISCSEWSETGTNFIVIAFEVCFRICHQDSRRISGKSEIKWNTPATADDDIFSGNTCAIKNTETLLEASRVVSLKVNTEKSQYMVVFHH